MATTEEIHPHSPPATLTGLDLCPVATNNSIGAPQCPTTTATTIGPMYNANSVTSLDTLLGFVVPAFTILKMFLTPITLHANTLIMPIRS